MNSPLPINNPAGGRSPKNWRHMAGALMPARFMSARLMSASLRQAGVLGVSILGAGLLSTGLLLASPAMAADSKPAQADMPQLKIGVLTDMSGVLSSGLGEGSVDGARMAIEDFGGQMFGKPIELVSADHQSKADIGAAVARRWFEQDGVSMVADMGASAVALAVKELVESHKKIAINVGASSSDLTGKACSPNTAQWSQDSYMWSNSLPKRLVAEGKKKWFLIVQDWAFGHAMQRDITKVVTDGGGEIVGAVRHPPGLQDYSSVLLQAQNSGADAVAFLNAVSDMTNSVKQAKEFGLGADGSQQLVALAFLLTDAHGLGPAMAQGIQFSSVWYWDMNPAARAWSERFMARNKGMPHEAHAGVYSAVTHYLKAVKATGSTDPAIVMAEMRKNPVDDFFQDKARLREDGRLLRKVYLARMKTPEASKGPWDYYELGASIPGEEAFRPLSDNACPLVKG